MEKWKQLLRSRKFWAALVGLGMVVLRMFKPDFPLSDEQVVGLAVVLASYILGVAVEDAGLARSR